MIPGSRGRSGRLLRAAVLALAAGVCVALPALRAVPAAAAAGGADRPGREQAWGWDGRASAVPAGCAATAGGGIACGGLPMTNARVVLRARLPRVPGAVTRIALDRAGLTLPASGRGRHTYTLTWSPAAVTLAVDGREVSGGVSYPGPRRLRVTVTSAHRVPAGAGLVVESLRVEGRGVAGASGAASVPPGPGTPVALPGQVGSELPGRLPDAISALQTTTLGASWLLGGTCVAVGVLLGVLRAALVSRRRPLVPH